MSFDRLSSDGTAGGTGLAAPEDRAVEGEELWWPPGQMAHSAGVLVTERTALQLSAILATVNTIATDTAVLPLCVHQKMPDDSRREATEHPAYELVTRSPDDETTPLQFRQSLMGHALEYGNGYAEIQRRGRGSPYALHLLCPETTRVKRVDGRLGYQLGNGNWLEAANVLHIAGLGYDGVTGYNFIKLLRQAIGLGKAAETYGADYFANGSEPNGVIETPERLKPEAVKALREGWEDVHGGAGKRHRTAVLSGGAKFNATTTDPESSQLLETRKFQVTDSVRPWRVPPQKVGDFSEAHLSNIEASNLDYLMTALMGWLVAWEQQCNLKLLTRAEFRSGYYFEHNVAALLRGDVMSRYGAYEIATRNGWMSRDEIRMRENLNPIGEAKGGKLYTVQSQNVPLESITKPPEPAPPVGAPPADQATPDPATGKPPAKRELRFNSNHSHDGKFSTGHGAAIGAAVSAVKAEGVAVDPEGNDALTRSLGEHKASLVPAAYQSKSKTIVINEKSTYWSHPEATMAKASGSKWFSSGSADHIVNHELGHALHDRKDPANYHALKSQSFTDAQKEFVSRDVSRYAATKPLEMVAEVYAGSKAGRSFSPKTMEFYARLKGPAI